MTRILGVRGERRWGEPERRERKRKKKKKKKEEKEAQEEPLNHRRLSERPVPVEPEDVTRLQHFLLLLLLLLYLLLR